MELCKVCNAAPAVWVLLAGTVKACDSCKGAVTALHEHYQTVKR